MHSIALASPLGTTSGCESGPPSASRSLKQQGLPKYYDTAAHLPRGWLGLANTRHPSLAILQHQSGGHRLPRVYGYGAVTRYSPRRHCNFPRPFPRWWFLPAWSRAMLHPPPRNTAKKRTNTWRRSHLWVIHVPQLGNAHRRRERVEVRRYVGQHGVVGLPAAKQRPAQPPRYGLLATRYRQEFPTAAGQAYFIFGQD